MKGIWFIGIAAMLLGTVQAASTDEPKPTVPAADFRWVPERWAAFAHIRFAEIWDSPSGNALFKCLPAYEAHAMENFEKSLGVLLSEIDQISIVYSEYDASNPEACGVVVRLTTRQPYDRERLRDAILQSSDSKQPLPSDDSKSLFRLGRAGPVQLTDKKNLTYYFAGDAAGLKSKILRATASEQSGRKLQSSVGDNHLFVAVESAGFRDLPSDQRPKWYGPPLTVGRSILTGNVNRDEIEFRFRTECPSEADVTTAHKSILSEWDNAQRNTNERLKYATERFDPIGKVILHAVSAAIRDAQVATDGNVLTVKAGMQTGSLVEFAQKDGGKLIKAETGLRSSRYNLMEIVLAMHNYAARNTYLPPAAICDAAEKPLLSWRVAILPFLGEPELYSQFHFNEPWDSEHNKKLIARMPRVYKLYGDETKREMPSTYYRLLVGNDAAFAWDKRRTIEEIAKVCATGDELMLVESEDALPWTKPEELEYDPKKPVKLGYHFGDRCCASMVDGQVVQLHKGIKDELLHAAIQMHSPSKQWVHDSFFPEK